MKFSIAHNFDPAFIPALAPFARFISEVYGKLDRDIIGGGRSSYTLPRISNAHLHKAVRDAHALGIGYNYLLNGATLGGVEQTRAGQKKIRRRLDGLSCIGVDAITVASPYLLRLVKRSYPHFRVRISVFAAIDSGLKARQWEDYGADALCISAIACNRRPDKLAEIRASVSCELQLLANASCMQGCAYELTHMNLLTESSRRNSSLGEYCLDYCFLNCSAAKLRDSAVLMKAIWIRPEDLFLYEKLGYDSFKLVERSCPTDLLIRRVQAYVNRRFEGNLMELIAPVAKIKRGQGASLPERLRMVTAMAKPWRVKIDKLLKVKQYADMAVQHDFTRTGPVFIDNRALDGWLETTFGRPCARRGCTMCGACARAADAFIEIDPGYKEKMLALSAELDELAHGGGLWLNTSR